MNNVLQNMDNTNIYFNSLKRADWLRQIATVRNEYKKENYQKQITFVFKDTLSPELFQPIHVVTIACLIEFLVNVEEHTIRISNESIEKLFFEDLKFREYWNYSKDHVDSESDNIFNLWRIVENQKDAYAIEVEQYFKKNFFRGKDLSIISLSIVEAFYNVFDHADANGNAFSFIKYEGQDEVLRVAICDFGKGISKSVRNFDSTIISDSDALKKSIEVDFTVGSKVHNKGKGLDNILSCADAVRIICNTARLLKKHEVKIDNIDFDFNGTLIYFELYLGNLEEEEILDEFDF